MMDRPLVVPKWRKNSRSGGSDTECVEVADLQSTADVRDSKQPCRPHIAVSRSGWTRLVVSLRTQQVGIRSSVAPIVSERRGSGAPERSRVAPRLRTRRIRSGSAAPAATWRGRPRRRATARRASPQ
ncbi:DUF397 domain-containing protein [Streptomyces sp. NPDC002206]